ncbi:unnamed protein product [Cochlearia groenlandica]
MRRRNHRTKAAESVKKTDSKSGFAFHDPSSSRAHTDLKRRTSVTFVDVDSPLNNSTENPKLDAKTSEFAAFKKFKSGFGLFSESYDSKSSKKAEHKPKTFESISKREEEFAGSDRYCKDRCNNGYSFSTPVRTTRHGSSGLFNSPVNLALKEKEKGPEKSSSAFRRDKDTIQSGNDLRSGGIGDEEDDIFSLKRKKLHQWVKDTWFTETPELKSNGNDLVSILLSRLIPDTEETYPSRFSKEMTDRVKRKRFLDSPGSKFRKRSHENYTEVDHRLQIGRDRSNAWQGCLDNSITPRLQFQTGHVQSSFIPRFVEEISFPISYPKRSVYRPPLLNQKASVSFHADETLDYSPLPSFHVRNHKPLSLGYHREDSEYSSGDLSRGYRPPPSSLLLEWNTETASTRKTDDLPLSYHTELITYPNASSSSSVTDNPWSSDYSSSHDLVTRDLFPLPLLSHYTSDSVFLPILNQTSRFEHELESRVIFEEDAANQNLLTQSDRYKSHDWDTL